MKTTTTHLAALLLAGVCAQSAAAADDGGFGDLRWRLLGPFRGGWATMVEGVPDAPDTVYFGAAGGGLWRTTNAGRTWTSLFDHGPAASIGALAVAPSDPKVIYLGTGQPEPRYDVAGGRGLFKSVDGGAHWTTLGLEATRYIGRIWVDPSDAQRLLVGAQGHFFGPSPDRGVYRSQDGGATWNQTLKLGDWTGVSDLASDPADAKVIFAAAWEARQYPWQSYFTPVAGPGSAIYRSSDGGLSWSQLGGAGWPAGPLGRISLATTRTPAGLRVYATVDSATAGGLYRSDDAGAHWSRVNAEPAFTSWYASRITVAPNDPDVVYTVGQSIRRCAKGGTECAIIRGSPGGDDYHHVWINPKHPDHMATASDQGAVVSVDAGRTWSDWYNQPTGQFYHLAADTAFPYRVYSGQQDSGTVSIASRSDYGAIGLRDWRPVGGDERDDDIPDPHDPNLVYASGLGGRITRWDARTGQVQNISPWPVSSYGQRPTLVRYHYNWVSTLAVSRAGPTTLYSGAQTLLRSTDRGAHWTTISGDLTGKTATAVRCDGDVALVDARPCGYGTVTAVEPSPRHAGEIWVGADDGLIHRTQDGGAHWRDVTPPALSAWSKIATLEVSALEDGVAYAAVDRQRLDDIQPHAWRTRDGGATWRDIAVDLPRDHFVSVVRADPVQRGLLYAGTDAGAFVSFDDGDHWRALQQNLPTAWVRDLLVHGDDLIAATQGRAIWVLDDVTALRQLAAARSSAADHLFTPAAALRVRTDNNKDTPPTPETPLGENPPEGAMIDYQLSADAHAVVTLEIRDANGRLVRRFSSRDPAPTVAAEVYFDPAWLHAEPRLATSPGLHRFVWDLRWPRPPAIGFDYSIAAVWNRGVPATPQGAWVVPGQYRVVLSVDGLTQSAPLRVALDPRVTVAPADLRASLALSQTIDVALAEARRGFGETTAVAKALATLAAPASVAAPAAALAAGLHAPPALHELDFAGVSAALAAIETDLEGADTAPTPAQAEVVRTTRTQLARAEIRWSALKAGRLAALDQALTAAGRAPIVIPTAGELKIEPPNGGQDLP